jgi:hypothetical protein
MAENEIFSPCTEACENTKDLSCDLIVFRLIFVTIWQQYFGSSFIYIGFEFQDKTETERFALAIYLYPILFF